MNPDFTQYYGNPDYRGYLNYLGKTTNPDSATARQLLGLQVGNDAGFNPTIGPVAQGLQNINHQLYSRYQQLNSPVQTQGYNPQANVLGSIGGASYATPPPNWDLTSIYNQAGSQAANQVNPYYSKQLTNFITQQQESRQQAYNQYNFNLQNLQQDLTNTQQANTLTGQRTSQDVLNNEQQLGIQADRQQVDQGGQFDEARIAQAKQLATQGLTTSGLGAQQVAQSQQQHNLQESRQAEDLAQQTAAQELTKARTFEDLGRSNILAQASKTRSEKQYKTDIDKFIQGQGADLQGQQQSLEQQRLERLSSVQRQLAQQQVNDMIHALSNPQQRLAATQAYAGAF